MSIFKTLWETITKVFAVAKAVIEVAGPIVQGLRKSIPAVNEILTKFEDNVEKGGEGADNYLDRNLGVIGAVGGYADRGIYALTNLKELCNDLVTYSQVETPDTITPEEAQKIVKKMAMFREAWGSLDDSGAELEKALKAAK